MYAKLLHLTCRTGNNVSVIGYNSSMEYVMIGVPQGSVLDYFSITIIINA